jgi:hypothetical protein
MTTPCLGSVGAGLLTDNAPPVELESVLDELLKIELAGGKGSGTEDEFGDCSVGASLSIASERGSPIAVIS